MSEYTHVCYRDAMFHPANWGIEVTAYEATCSNCGESVRDRDPKKAQRFIQRHRNRAHPGKSGGWSGRWV